MRLFVGVPLPSQLRKALHEVYAPLEGVSGLKVVEKENLHITLKFIGEFPERRLKELKAALSCVRFKSIPVEIVGVGAFPSTSFPRVVWAGVRGGFDELVCLADAVEAALEPLGVRRESRPFHPHITLARVKRVGREILDFLEQNRERTFGSIVVTHFVLFQSTLTPSGPIYTELARFLAEDIKTEGCS